MTETKPNDSTQPDETVAIEVDPIDRRAIMTKLVAAAALAATGLVSGEAGADARTASKPPVATIDKEKVDKWNESYKYYKESTVKLMKLRTGFRVEIQATPELGATLRSMGLVSAASDTGTVKLSIEFSSS